MTESKEDKTEGKVKKFVLTDSIISDFEQAKACALYEIFSNLSHFSLKVLLRHASFIKQDMFLYFFNFFRKNMEMISHG